MPLTAAVPTVLSVTQCCRGRPSLNDHQSSRKLHIASLTALIVHNSLHHRHRGGSEAIYKYYIYARLPWSWWRHDGDDGDVIAVERLNPLKLMSCVRCRPTYGQYRLYTRSWPQSGPSADDGSTPLVSRDRPTLGHVVRDSGGRRQDGEHLDVTCDVRGVVVTWCVLIPSTNKLADYFVYIDWLN